jgi:hypothetical protein
MKSKLPGGRVSGMKESKMWRCGDWRVGGLVLSGAEGLEDGELFSRPAVLQSSGVIVVRLILVRR